MARPLEDVYCTLLMSDSYLPGAAVLAHSLRDAGTKKKLAVLITLDTLSADTITQLKTLYDYLIPVERIRNPNPANLYLMGRPDLSFAFTKIALWRQTQFRKIVYLDADVVALRALEELFDIEASFAAAPDIGWPDAFNSGVMVISPDMGEYWALQTMAASGDSFDGADQGLLNQYFEHRPWQRLKFTYNCTPNAEYQWEPAYRHYKRDISAVHFIGKNKPWSGERSGRPGVYGELLSRWWQVHDRHLRKEASGNAQQQTGSGTEHISSSASVPNIVIEPEAPVTSTEAPITELGEEAENIDQGVVEPTPTVQQRKFSAPEMEWDATKFEPPTQSKPEAANFPTAQYTFSDSHQLFKAPQAYPEPPRDMWYQVPQSKPKPAAQPKPIFPWEQQPGRPKATRVFAEDLPPEPTPVPAVSSPTHAFSTVHYDDNDQAAPGESSEGVKRSEYVPPPKSADKQWQAFQESSVNAWDSVPGIENYVRAIMDSHGRRTKTQVLQQTTGTEELSSPLLERRNRRESLILTDFPSAVERPSLPVTPAPIKCPSFWGEERNETGELPAAEGVPDQTDWNPNAKLEQLRRSSLAEFEHLTKDPHPNPPLRSLPEHSVLHHENTADHHSLTRSGLSPRLDQTGAFDGTAEQNSGQASAQDAPTQAVTSIGQLSHANDSGIATVDFAQRSESIDNQQFSSASTDGDGGLFFSSQGLVSESSVTSQSVSNSTSQQHFSSQQMSSAQHTASQQSSSSGTQQIQSGKMTFTLPNSGKDDKAEAVTGGEVLISPTQSHDEPEKTGEGLF